jgi:23S rRNA (guanosine2251-2'-O)-methyltransferase
METVEGRVSVLAALQAGQRRFESILIDAEADDDSVGDVLAAAQGRGVTVRRAGRDELASLAHGRSHGGVIALCTPKPLTTPGELGEIVACALDERSRGADAPLLLLLEGADDARNLGFTLRSAEAFGAHAVLLRKRAWAFDAVEVARPSSGAYERLPIVLFDDVLLLEELRGRGLKLVGCLANVRRSIFDASLDWPTILAIGGEKRGLSGAVRAMCDRLVRIPTRDGASLALSHAASIALAEAARQRLAARERGATSV